MVSGSASPVGSGWVGAAFQGCCCCPVQTKQSLQKWKLMRVYNCYTVWCVFFLLLPSCLIDLPCLNSNNRTDSWRDLKIASISWWKPCHSDAPVPRTHTHTHTHTDDTHKPRTETHTLTDTCLRYIAAIAAYHSVIVPIKAQFGGHCPEWNFRTLQVLHRLWEVGIPGNRESKRYSKECPPRKRKT